MKKLLVLALVCGMASMVNAAIVLQTLDGSTTVTAGQLVTIQLAATANENVSAMSIALITDNGAGGLATPGAVNVKFTNTPDAGYNGIDLGLGGTAGDVGYINGAVELPNYATGILYTYTYKVSDTWDGSAININAPNVAESYAFPTFVGVQGAADVTDFGTLTLTPEPMTLVLLGLGGLFIRRK